MEIGLISQMDSLLKVKQKVLPIMLNSFLNINFKDEKRVRQTYNRRRRELAKRIKELEAELEAQQAAENVSEPTSEQSSEQATA